MINKHKKKLLSIQKQMRKIEKDLSGMSWETSNDDLYCDFQYFSRLLTELRDKFLHLFQEAEDND